MKVFRWFTTQPNYFPFSGAELSCERASTVVWNALGKWNREREQTIWKEKVVPFIDQYYLLNVRVSSNSNLFFSFSLAGRCRSWAPTRTRACTRTRSTPASITSTRSSTTTTTARESSSMWVSKTVKDEIKSQSQVTWYVLFRALPLTKVPKDLSVKTLTISFPSEFSRDSGWNPSHSLATQHSILARLIISIFFSLTFFMPYLPCTNVRTWIFYGNRSDMANIWRCLHRRICFSLLSYTAGLRQRGAYYQFSRKPLTL